MSIRGAAAALALLGLASSCAHFPASVPRLDGSVWQGSRVTGEPILYELMPGGVLVYQTEKGRYGNSIWRQDGHVILMRMNDGFAELVGAVDGDAMAGTASNREGRVWSWSATRVTGTVSPLSPAPEATR